MKGLEELKRMAYENACCRCQYCIDKKCTNNGECVWKTIEKELKKGIACRKFLVAITRELTEQDFEGFTVNDLNEIMKENGINETFSQEEYDLIKEEILCH